MNGVCLSDWGNYFVADPNLLKYHSNTRFKIRHWRIAYLRVYYFFGSPSVLTAIVHLMLSLWAWLESLSLGISQ